jgi:AcrR family transcriptional regulator
MSSSASPRSWAGVGLAERQEIRRSELLRVGVELLGAPDGPAVNVRAVCKAAGLTERYFYESFPDRDQFVLAVYEHVAEQARGVLVDAVASTTSPADLAESAVRAFVELIVDRPAMGRVLLIAPMADTALAERGMQHVPGFGMLIENQLSEIDDAEERQMTAVGLVGALASLHIAYLDGGIKVDREKFVAHCVRLLGAANRRR